LRPWLGLLIILGLSPASKSSICRFIHRRLNLTFSLPIPIVLSFTHSPDFIFIFVLFTQFWKLYYLEG
jgi:hypothetical protein